MDTLNLSAGDLNRFVTIQSPATGSGPGGGPATGGATLVRKGFAKLSTRNSQEFYQTSQYTAEVTHIVSMRWTPVAISEGMQVLYGSRVFNVQTVENVMERNVRLNLICVEINQTEEGET